MSTTPAPADLGRIFCDLVMKGGITSGVVYPTAVAGLARRYRLRNIGGASVGAIAAAAAAAAEYRRQTQGGEAGFDRLARLPAELGAPPAADPGGRKLLFQLFQPTALSRPLFGVLADMLNRPSWKARAALGVGALLRAFPGTVVLGLLALGAAAFPVLAALAAGFRAALDGPGGTPGRALLLGAGVLPALLALVAAAAAAVLAIAGWRALRHLALVMARQDFGLCTGKREGPDGPPALTEWIHALVQEVAGKPEDAPLTFGDLRRLRFEETPGRDGVVLRTVTTCLTLGRPYTMPFDERLFFDPEELRRYFPEPVVRWMEAHARPKGREEEDEERLPEPRAPAARRRLVALPAPDDLPVVVAVRMSLSFPILLSAIPLHRFSPRREGGAWVREFERLVFTDGGVCSNLPVHLFDAPLPCWPTFALNLRDDLPADAKATDRVVRPKRGLSYTGDRYPISGGESLGALGSFLVAVVKTMQNWRDMLQRAAPGAKERVFTVRHTADEGGLNLDMDAGAIGRMSDSGALAAAAILEEFLAEPGTPPAEDDWQHHRWVRLRLLLPVLRRFLGQLEARSQPAGGAPSVEELLTASPRPMGRSYELNDRSREAAWALLSELGAASRDLEARGADLERTEPRPPGELRVTPSF